jgi:hypothetical protein
MRAYSYLLFCLAFAAASTSAYARTSPQSECAMEVADIAELKSLLLDPRALNSCPVLVQYEPGSVLPGGRKGSPIDSLCASVSIIDNKKVSTMAWD